MKTTTTERPGQHGKSITERVGYALGHRVRIEILTLLNEGVYTADDLASIVGESRQNVHHHLRELLSAGSIEIAKTEKRRNTDLFYYRAIGKMQYDEEQFAAMPAAKREAIVGLIVQDSTAEIMAAMSAGKLHNDRQAVLAWRWFNLDAQGRKELTDEQTRLWERFEEIEAKSASRRIESGEDATSVIVAEWGFERVRTAPPSPSANADKTADSA